MLIAIDASSANKLQKTGVEWYAYHMIEHMKKQPLNSGERVVLFSPSTLAGTLGELPKGWTSRVLNWPFGQGWMRVRVAMQLLIDRPDVFFVPSQGVPFSFTPLVTTIHDIGPLRLPNVYPLAHRLRVQKATRRAIRRARILFTASEFTKRELMEALHVDQAKIIVTPNAADASVYQKLGEYEINSVLGKFRLGRHFFLMVGRGVQNKNLETAQKAFEIFKAQRGLGDPFEFVHVGDGAKGSIRELGYLTPGEIAALMNACTAYISPSWYEGFDVPTLEAMTCGAPVIASDILPHREVCKDAARFVLPQDVQGWVRAMEQVADSSAVQDAMRNKGFDRAKVYSWDSTARTIWDALRSLI